MLPGGNYMKRHPAEMGAFLLLLGPDFLFLGRLAMPFGIFLRDESAGFRVPVDCLAFRHFCLPVDISPLFQRLFEIQCVCGIRKASPLRRRFVFKVHHGLLGLVFGASTFSSPLWLDQDQGIGWANHS